MTRAAARFGFCLLQSRVWQPHVLRVVIDALKRLLASDCAAIQPDAASVDILFCHQTCHHLVEQEQTLVNLVARKPLQCPQP